MLLLLLELLEWLLLDDGEEEGLMLRGTFTVSPLDEEVSWLLLCSLPLVWLVQPALAFMLPADAEAPAAAALAMTPRLSKHPSNSVVARMAIKPPRQ